MCGRFTLTVELQDLGPLFSIASGPGPSPNGFDLPRYNMAPTQDGLLVRWQDSSTRRIDWGRWGLVPPRMDTKKAGAKFINARAETVFERVSFRSAAKSRRCLVPADGFIEWTRKEKVKLPHHIRRPDRKPFAMAGIWEEKNEQLSFSVLTTKPNNVVSPLHDRMPVILPPDVWDPWLDPSVRDLAALETLLRPIDDDWIEAVPVSRRVNKVANDDATCLDAPEPEIPPPQLGFGF